MAVRTNLIVPVPAAEPVVGTHRARLDPTLDAIGPPELSHLEALFAATSS